MHRCGHSMRALEGIVNDLAAINLREHRARQFFLHARRFSTRPRNAQLQSRVGTNHDDSFIPFDSKSSVPRRVFAARKDESENVLQESKNGDEGVDDWHAEVELIPSTTSAQLPEEIPVDYVSLKVLESDERQHGLDATTPAPVLSLPAISQHMNAPQVSKHVKYPPPGSKSESRIQRKLRRVEAGKWRPTASQKAVADQEGNNSIADALNKIDWLEGPSLAKSDAKDPVKHILTAGKEEAGKITEKSKDKQGVSKTTRTPTPMPTTKPKKERWMIEKEALKRKFGEEGWQPRKRLSPDTLEGIRALHASDPTTYSTPTLASHFQITPEAIRRILRSKWRPSAEDSVKRMERWEKRGLKKWQEMAAQGIRPPKKWKEMGVEDPNAEKRRVKEMIRKKTRAETSWDAAVEAADRLPMEGSFADRIL